MASNSVLLQYYVKALRGRLQGGRDVLWFTVASTVHGFGHGLIGLLGSALALALMLPGGGLGRRGVLVGGPWAHGTAADQALFVSLVGLCAIVVKAGAGVVATYVQARVAGGMGESLRLELFDALLTIHRLRHPRQEDQGGGVVPTAGAVVALTDRVRDVEQGLGHGLLAAARAVLQLTPLALVLVWLSPHMALAGAVLLLALGWGIGRLRRSFREALRLASRDHERLVSAADDAVRHAELWVAFGAQQTARASIRALGQTIARGSAWLEGRAAATSGANEVLGAATLVFAVATSRAGWLGPADDGGRLFAFAVTFFMAYRPLRELAEARLTLARAEAAYEDLEAVRRRALAASAKAEPARTGPASQGWPLQRLELRALCLARGAGDSISLVVEPGTIAVVVGPTGAGKTTLLRTLLGLESPRSGDMLFGAKSFVTAHAGPEGRPFAWVPQESPVLAESLARNISLGVVDVDPASVLAPFGAAHLARELGEAPLGAAGRAVSGGERQWIALARALATRQPVLLLDEPTSGLDGDAQRLVLDAIRRVRGERTVIVVTHRTEPLALADVVLRLGGVGSDHGGVGRAA